MFIKPIIEIKPTAHVALGSLDSLSAEGWTINFRVREASDPKQLGVDKKILNDAIVEELRRIASVICDIPKEDISWSTGFVWLDNHLSDDTFRFRTGRDLDVKRVWQKWDQLRKESSCGE